MAKVTLYVGSCNRKTPYFASANGQGIAIFELDTDSGKLTSLDVTRGIDNPTFVTVSPDGRYLYANSEVFEWNEGTVTAYAIDPTDGGLDYINKQAAQGSITAFLGFDGAARHLLIANYAMLPASERPNQSVVVFPIREDGGLASVCSSAVHDGAGTHPERQERSHAHSVRISPDGRNAVAADLGTDTLVCYAFDPSNGQLTPTGKADLVAGSGPRHLVFDTARERLYVSNELNATVSMFSYAAGFGALRYLDSVTTIPDGAGESHCSEVTLAPGGHIFVGNRGHESVATIAVSEDAMCLHLVSNTSTNGHTPRHMAIDPSGRFLVVANQDSDRLEVFSIAPTDDALTHVGGADTGTPTSLAFGNPMPDERATDQSRR